MIYRYFKQLTEDAHKHKNIETYLGYLRSIGFYFVDSKPFLYLVSNGDIDIKLKPIHLTWQFMVRKNHEKVIDPDFVVSVKLWGKKIDKIIVYSTYLSKPKKLPLFWKDHAEINFRKTTKKWAFPDYLDYEQRRVWRSHHYKREKNIHYNPPQWYWDALPDIVYL